MRSLLAVVFSLSFSVAAWADVVCLEKGTNRVLSYQTHGSVGICKQNWIDQCPTCTFNPADIEERQVTRQEYATLQAIWDADPTNPAVAARKQRETKRKGKEAAIKAKLGLSDQDWKNLNDALRDP